MGIFPCTLRVGDGNESDLSNVCDLLGLQTAMANDALFVADAAFYTQENLQQMFYFGGCREYQAPDCCKTLLENMPEAFNDSVISDIGLHLL